MGGKKLGVVSSFKAYHKSKRALSDLTKLFDIHDVQYKNLYAYIFVPQEAGANTLMTQNGLEAIRDIFQGEVLRCEKSKEILKEPSVLKLKQHPVKMVKVKDIKLPVKEAYLKPKAPTKIYTWGL